MIANICIKKDSAARYSWTLNFFKTEESVLSECSLNSNLDFSTEHDCIEHMKETTKNLFPKLKMVLTESEE